MGERKPIVAATPMGYAEGYTRYQNYLEEMMNDFEKKYFPFLDKVDKLAKKRNV